MLAKMRILPGRQGLQRGFTLVELIIVMAILAVLAAIALPRYNGILNESKVKSDAVTAAGITSGARIQETSTGSKVTCTVGYEGLDANYFEAGKKPSSGGDFALSGGGNNAYVVKWTPTVGVYEAHQQTLTEGSVFVPNTTT